MLIRKLIISFLGFLVLIIFNQCSSQHSFVSTKKSYWKYPHWVKAIDDPSANYYKTVKQYDRYWSRHFAPNCSEEENELDRGRKDLDEDARPFYVKIFQSEERAKEKSNNLNIERKRFEKWKLEMMPYIKADGHIMTPEERIKAWSMLNNM